MTRKRTWERLAKETVFSCPYYRLSHDRYERPDGEIGDYFYVDIPGSTMVIPRLDDGRFVLTRQYRYLMGRHSVEFPAGGLPLGIESLDNAKKELREEAGYSAAHWEKLGEFAPYNGVSNELCRAYLATGLTAVGADPEPTEEISNVVMSGPEIEALIESGELWDGMTVNTWFLYTLYSRNRPR